jgi:hypothetical protein
MLLVVYGVIEEWYIKNARTTMQMVWRVEGGKIDGGCFLLE